MTDLRLMVKGSELIPQRFWEYIWIFNNDIEGIILLKKQGFVFSSLKVNFNIKSNVPLLAID